MPYIQLLQTKLSLLEDGKTFWLDSCIKLTPCRQDHRSESISLKMPLGHTLLKTDKL